MLDEKNNLNIWLLLQLCCSRWLILCLKTEMEFLSILIHCVISFTCSMNATSFYKKPLLMLGCKGQHQRKFQLENQEAKRTITNYPDSPLPDLLLSLKQKYSNNSAPTMWQVLLHSHLAKHVWHKKLLVTELMFILLGSKSKDW